MSFAGQGAISAAPLVQGIIVARFLGADALGLLALCMAIVAPLGLIFSLSLRTLIISTASAAEFPTYRILRTIGIAAFCLTSVIVITSASDNQFRVVFGAVAIAKCVEMHFELDQARNTREHETLIVNIGHVLRAATGILIIWASLSFGLSLYAAIFLTACGSVVVGLTIDTQGHKNYSSNDLMGALRNLRKSGIVASTIFAVSAASALESVSQNLPRYYTGAYGTKFDVGVMTAILYFMMPGIIVLSAVSAVVIPRLADLYRRGDIDRFKSHSAKLCAVGAVAGTVAFIILGADPDRVMRLVYSTEFEGYSLHVRIALCAAVLWYVAALLGNALTAAGLHGANLRITALSFFAGVCGLMLMKAVYPAGDLALHGVVCVLIAMCSRLGLVTKEWRSAMARAAVEKIGQAGAKPQNT